MVIFLIGLCSIIIMITPCDAQVTKFVATGDTRGDQIGVNTIKLSEIVQATIDEGAQFIIITGDLVYGSSDQAVLEAELTEWRNTVQPLYDSGIGVYPWQQQIVNNCINQDCNANDQQRINERSQTKDWIRLQQGDKEIGNPGNPWANIRNKSCDPCHKR